MNRSITINNRVIGREKLPYIIAEMSANHNGSLESAFKIIEAAKFAGADAVKIQTYRADTLTLKSELPDFQIESGLWKGKTLYELYEWAHTPWEWHKDLFEYARKIGITLFSSPFDSTAVDLLEDLNTPAYKIASFEAIDLQLIEYVANTGKPMIISTGMANLEEINEAIETAKTGGCEELAVLHCVSGYPAPAKDYCLLTIPDMIQRFDLVTGLSDHTLDNVTAISSIALGASIIEKHFTLDRSGDGADNAFSLEPEGLTDLCRDAKISWQALGKIDYERKSSEKDNLKFRRSLYFTKNLPEGEKVDEHSIRCVRPGYGLHPRYLKQILGKELTLSANENTPVTLKHFGLSS